LLIVILWSHYHQHPCKKLVSTEFEKDTSRRRKRRRKNRQTLKGHHYSSQLSESSPFWFSFVTSLKLYEEAKRQTHNKLQNKTVNRHGSTSTPWSVYTHLSTLLSQGVSNARLYSGQDSGKIDKTEIGGEEEDDEHEDDRQKVFENNTFMTDTYTRISLQHLSSETFLNGGSRNQKYSSTTNSNVLQHNSPPSGFPSEASECNDIKDTVCQYKCIYTRNTSKCPSCSETECAVIH
jgi:hypothetical protein